MQKQTLKLALGQLLVEGGEPERNLERAIDLVKQAKAKGCEMVLLPETLDLGWTHPSALEEAESVPDGKYAQHLCQVAHQEQLYICAGLTEKKGGKVYNTAVFINPQGEIIHVYRKINVLEVARPFYSIGQSLGVVDTEFGKIGINICSDNYMESLCLGHSLGKMGAQIILSPSSWTVDYHINEANDPYQEKWERPYRILAESYDLVIAGTTSVGYLVGGPYEGKKMVGCSLMMGKNGILAQGNFNEFASELIVSEFQIPKRNGYWDN